MKTTPVAIMRHDVATIILNVTLPVCWSIFKPLSSPDSAANFNDVVTKDSYDTSNMSLRNLVRFRHVLTASNQLGLPSFMRSRVKQKQAKEVFHEGAGRGLYAFQIA